MSQLNGGQGRRLLHAVPYLWTPRMETVIRRMMGRGRKQSMLHGNSEVAPALNKAILPTIKTLRMDESAEQEDPVNECTGLPELAAVVGGGAGPGSAAQTCGARFPGTVGDNPVHLK